MGMCLTDDESSAEAYALGGGCVTTVDLDLSSLTVARVDAFDLDAVEAAGDRAVAAVSR